MKKGDTVLVRYKGRTVEALVEGASENQLAAFISFEAILGGNVGGMPLTRDSAHQPWRHLITGESIEVKERDAVQDDD